MKRREFTREHKAAMIRRASDEKGQIFCEGCGLNVTGKRIEFDHVIAEALILDKTRPLTAADGQLLGYECCHRSPDGKTARDIEAISRAKRLELKRAGAQTKLRGRGFAKAAPQRRASAPLQKWRPFALNVSPGRGDD